MSSPIITVDPTIESRCNALDDIVAAVTAAQESAARAAMRSVIRQVHGAAAARFGWNLEGNHVDFEAFVDAGGADLDFDPLRVWDSIQPLAERILSLDDADRVFDRSDVISVGDFYGTIWLLDAEGEAEDAVVDGAVIDQIATTIAPDAIDALISALRARKAKGL